MIVKYAALLSFAALAAIGTAVHATAQTPPTTPVPIAAPLAPPTWSVGPIDFSGYIDGYYSYNANRPSSLANGQVNDLYNFNDKTDQFNLSAAKLTLNHDPDPIGIHIDFLYGRTNKLINQGGDTDFIEQAFISIKPPKSKGLELDFGKFVTAAGAEVVESKDNWNYSRSLLYAYAIPYYHFGLRSSLPITKSWTAGLHVVNGWNDVSTSNGGVTIGLTSAWVKTKYSWNVNYYTGPQNNGTQKGYRNLIDTTLLLTPTTKFNAYLNYDYGQNRDALSDQGNKRLNHWQGVALALHEQMTAKSALSGRFEYFTDRNGFTTGTAQDVKELTATYEYKWIEGLLMRAEYRRDWSTRSVFHKGDTGLVDAQSTATLGLVAFFGPKR